jgi:hypothetical protein
MGSQDDAEPQEDTDAWDEFEPGDLPDVMELYPNLGLTRQQADLLANLILSPNMSWSIH